jgi:predicted transcriptional regulator
MQTTTFRTTVDLDSELTRKLKEYAARHGLAQKTVITHAIKAYMGSEAQENDAEKLWTSLRKIASKSKKNINLTLELQKDRNR